MELDKSSLFPDVFVGRESKNKESSVALKERAILIETSKPACSGHGIADYSASKRDAKEQKSQFLNTVGTRDCFPVLPSSKHTIEVHGIQIMSPWAALEQLGPLSYFDCSRNGKKDEQKTNVLLPQQICRPFNNHDSSILSGSDGSTRYLSNCMHIQSCLINFTS